MTGLEEKNPKLLLKIVQFGVHSFENKINIIFCELLSKIQSFRNQAFRVKCMQNSQILFQLKLFIISTGNYLPTEVFEFIEFLF